MRELVWYALSSEVVRPVTVQVVPLWFAALLVFGLMCGGVLLASGVTQWIRHAGGHS